MKIAHASGRMDRMHGATKYVMSFASELRNQGHDSRIYCTSFKIPRPFWLTAEIVTRCGRSAEKRAEPAQQGRIARAFGGFVSVVGLVSLIPRDCDAVVLHSEGTIPLLPLIRMKCRSAKIVYYCYQPPREVYDLWDAVKGDFSPAVRAFLRVVIPIYKLVDRWLVRMADQVLVFSPQYRAYAVEIYGDLDYRIVPAGIDFTMFEPGDKLSDEKIRAIRGNHDHVLLMNASLTRKKNVHAFVELLSALKSEDMDVLGVVIGEGPLQSELEVLAAELGIADRLVLAGYVSQEDLPHYYHAADILYYLEMNGAWTMSVIEAGATRTPAIVAPGGSMPTILQDGVGGFVLPASDFRDALRHRTMELLRDRETRSRLGEGGYRHSLQFSLARSAETFVQALEGEPPS